MAGREIDSVHLALSDRTSRASPRGVIAVASKNREISRETCAIGAAKAVSLPTGREILHVLPRDFVDEQDGIALRRDDQRRLG
jgi:cell division protein FtsA